PVADVAATRAESDQPAVLTTEGGDDLVGPVATAVHPHAPAFILETPGRRRHRQLLIGLASLDVLGRIEALEVASEDLLGAVPLDLLGAPIPRLDPAIDVQHVDGELVDGVEEEQQVLGGGRPVEEPGNLRQPLLRLHPPALPASCPRATQLRWVRRW